LNDDQIIFNVTAVDEKVDDGIEDSVLDLKPPTSYTEAILSKCIDWFEIQEETNAMQVLLLHEIRNTAAQKARASKNRRRII